jgi:hypothetical protein
MYEREKFSLVATVYFFVFRLYIDYRGVSSLPTIWNCFPVVELQVKLRRCGVHDAHSHIQRMVAQCFCGGIGGFFVWSIFKTSCSIQLLEFRMLLCTGDTIIDAHYILVWLVCRDGFFVMEELTHKNYVSEIILLGRCPPWLVVSHVCEMPWSS